MVARPGTYQASNNAGELAPEEYGRTDLKQFYAGLAFALNIEPVPQGGSKLSMRTRHQGRIRKKLQLVALDGSSLSLGPFSDAGVVAAANFGLTAISVIVVPNWSATPAIAAILQLEYASADVWVPFGAPFSMGTESGSITVARPPGQPVVTTDVRLRMVSAPGAPTTFIGSTLIVKRETASLSLARARPFTFSLTQTYVAVLMDGHADFYRDGVYVGASAHAFPEAQLSTVDAPQRLDTMLLFNPATISQRILRDGSDSKWRLSNIPFDNIPQVDLGGSYVNQVADGWGLYLRFPTDPSNVHYNGRSLLISVNVNGEDAVVPTPGADPDWNAIAAALAVAIEATSAVAPGISVVTNASPTGTQSFSITFTGERNLGAIFALSAQVVNAGDAAATVAHVTRGDPGGEPLISAGRGYAACAAFYQDRLLTGGFAAKRGAWAASQTGEYFDLNTKLIAASGAILANIDTAGAEQLQHIVSDKYLALFTSDAEYFVSDRALDRSKPPTIVNSSRYGSAPDLPVLCNEGEIIFAARNKAVLYAAGYDEISTSYVPKPISLLAPHIVNAMTDMALQRPSGTASAARLWMPRDDGSITLGIMLRNQEVTAFVRWQTPGPVRSACVDGKNIPYLLVERTVDGAQELHLERLEQGLVFDDVVEQDFDPPQAAIGGLAVHEGAEVWALADGYVEGPFTVTDEVIVLSAAAANVKVGRWTPPQATTLPLPSEVAERTVLRRPKRVHTVRIDLVDTTSVAIGANDRPPRNVALARAGDPIDAAQAPVSRTIAVTGMTGFSDTGQVAITQTKPGQLAWRGITIEART